MDGFFPPGRDRYSRTNRLLANRSRDPTAGSGSRSPAGWAVFDSSGPGRDARVSARFVAPQYTGYKRTRSMVTRAWLCSKHFVLRNVAEFRGESPRGIAAPGLRQSRRRIHPGANQGMAHQLRNALTGARLSIQLHRKRCEYARTYTSMTVAQRRFADRHLSRDAAAATAEIGDRVTDLGPHDHTRSTRLSDLSDGTHTITWAPAAGMARVAQAARSAVSPDDEAGRPGPVPELPVYSSDFWPRSAE